MALPLGQRLAQWRLPALLGLTATVVGGAWSGRPSFWWDEAATVSMADRSLRSTLATLGHVDAVHGLYYVLIHGWFQVFGLSEFSARAPSALAVGIATAALVALARMFGGTRLGVIVGVTFMVLPRVTWAATEARSYAMVLALSTVTMLVLVCSLRTSKRAWWILYGVLAAFSVALFLYSAVLLLVHAVIVVFGAKVIPDADSKRNRFNGLCFVGASASAVLLVSPLIALSLGQSRQVSWIPPLDRHIFTTIAVDQWFLSSTLFAVVAGIIVLSGFAGYFFAPSRWTFGDRGASTVALVWMLVPMALFLVYSFVLGNIYIDRYVIFTAPGVALLLGVMISRLASSWVLASAAVILLAAASLPAYVGQREPWGKSGGMDYSTAADFLKANANAGDCVAFQPVVSWAPSSLHAVAEVRPDSIEGLRDVGLEHDANSIDELWDSEYSVDETAERAQSCQTVWVVTDGERQSYEALLHTANVVWNFEPFHFIDTELFTQLSARGFVVETATPLHHLQIVRMVPSTRR